MSRQLLLFEEASGEGKDLPGAAALPGENPPVNKWSGFLSDDDDADTGNDAGPQEAQAAEQLEEADIPAEETPGTPPASPETQELLLAPDEQRQSLAGQMTPEQLREARRQFEDALAARFQFSEDDAMQLQTEPEKVLPKLAARLQMDIMDALMQQMQQQVPVFVKEYTQASQREMEAQTSFYSAWPELKNYGQQVLQMGAAFRQLNPDASSQEAIERIGKMTMDALGLSRAQTASQKAAKAPAAPAFRPAIPGGVGGPPVNKTKWEAVFEPDD